MRRVLLLFVVALAASTVTATASADASCRNKIYNDWYKDGKIASTYPIACYRDALENVHGDAEIYSSLTDDIRSAMQAAIARKNGNTSVPAQVGKGLPKSDSGMISAGTKGDGGSTALDPQTPATGDDTSTVASAPVADSGGIPVPLLVLGGLALVLAAAGGLGMLARRRGPGDPAP